MELPFSQKGPQKEKPGKVIYPMKEVVAYEALWMDRKMSFQVLSRMFAAWPGKLPSELVPLEIQQEWYARVKEAVASAGKGFHINILIHGSFDYPKRLREAEDPVEMLYYTGNLDLLGKRSIAVVGTRRPSPEGLKEANAYTTALVRHGFAIVSGLAAGIDTAAHQAALEAGGNTIGVIGTPLDQSYPAENAELQALIAREHLLMTQVPFLRYEEQSTKGNRLFFPERNKTMAALTEATVIVEAGVTSGTQIQARAAIEQGRKLFILDRVFDRKGIDWPGKFVQEGAIRVRRMEDILSRLTPNEQ